MILIYPAHLLLLRTLKTTTSLLAYKVFNTPTFIFIPRFVSDPFTYFAYIAVHLHRPADPCPTEPTIPPFFPQHSILPTVPDRSNHHIFQQLLTCNRSPAATPLPHLRLLLLACCFPGHLSSFAARIHTILLVVSYSIRLQTDPDHSHPLYSRFSYRHPPSRSTSFNAAPRPLVKKPRVHDMTLTSSFHRYFTAQYLLIPSTIP